MAYYRENLKKYMKEIDESSEEVRKRKEKAVKILRNLADELDVKQRDMNIAKTSFASSGIVGAGLAVAGVIAAPFTLGASLGLTVAGVGVGVASGVGGLATAIAQGIINSKTRKEADKILDEYRESLKVFENLINEFIQEMRDKFEDMRQAIREMQSLIDKQKESETAKLILSVMKESCSKDGKVEGFQVGWRVSSCAGAALGRTAIAATAATGTAMRALRIGGAVLSVVTVPLDLYTIIDNSIKIDKKTPSQVAEHIRTIAKTLEEHKAVQCSSEK